MKSLALVVAFVVAGCSGAATAPPTEPPTQRPAATPTAAPPPTPTLPPDTCTIPDLVGMGITRTGARGFLKDAGFYGGVDEVGDATDWTVAKQLPSYPGTARCGQLVTIYETVVPTPEPTPEPTIEPSPTPVGWSSVSREDVAAVCGDTPYPYAAAYAGTIHPLVVVDDEGDGFYSPADWEGAFRINKKWNFNDGWPSPLQLVACVTDDWVVRDSCGTYKRSDGVTGKLNRVREVAKVRVIVALTGELLQTKTFYGSTPACAKTQTMRSGDDPPWTIEGDSVDWDAINTYVTAVSTHPAP
jgi:hypothetical protein